ncbi:MAG: sugar ABC transporter substrate-binding protein [Anaerolineae bacterium]|nr:sugar ABC transporter substrate-binding protein [Anaerolineae bacterium]
MLALLTIGLLLFSIGMVAAQEPVTLRLSVWGSLSDQEAYQARIDLAEQQFPDITVELLYTPDDYDQRIQTMMAGGDAPDIVQLAEAIHGYSSRGQLLPLDEMIASAGLDMAARFGTNHLQYQYEGSQYALPDRGGAMIVYYNTDMFDSAGLEYPNAGWTWENFLAAAQALTVREGDAVTQYGFAAGGWWPWWMSFIYQNGGAVLDESGAPAFNSAEAAEALQFYNDLVYTYEVAPSPEDYANLGTNSPDPLFAQGKVAMIMTGFWNIASLRDVPDLNWDIAPVWGNAARGTVAFGSGLAITSSSAHPEEAFQIIGFLTDEAAQTVIVERGQDAPANVAVLNSALFLSGETFANRDIYMEAFGESADAIIALPLIPQWNEMQSVMSATLDEYFLNAIDTQTAVEQLQADLEDLLQ